MVLKTRNDYEKIAEENGWKLTPYADKIIARVNANEGFCPCKSEEERKEHPENNYLCPCSLCEKDIEETNFCHCHLFCK